uniref:PH domain-containing protein n=1 Tax=Meloidogyne hapla TaxID=6305 RepID=A0A1I8BRB2_MELHA
MDWYSKLDSRATYICIVPESVEHCEENKDTFQKDNNLTDQAYDRVMAEAVQLLQSLKKQRELLDIDNSESVAHVEHLKKDIENRHLNEKERWKEQRIYLNTASKISTFLRDCFEIKKQLESWRQDLQGLRHSVSNTVEIIKQYHTQNTVKVQQVVSDAMKQLSEILELIQSKELHMVYAADSNIPIEEAIVTAARQLQNLEDEVMNIAKDISNRIELSIHLNKLRQMAHEVVEAIERQQMRLRQFFHIPGNEQETDLETKYFNEFRIEIEMFEEKISRFYNEKERFTSLPLLALESHAETRVRAENLLTDVKAKWQSLVGLIDIRYKLLTAANSYYKYTKLLLPTSQSIEKDLSMDRDGDFCKSGSWISLEHCYESTQERLEKHSSHKERFLEASVYAQRTADQFMNFMRRIQAPREHVEARLFEVQKYKDTIRERQTIILRLWTECHAKIDKCQNSVKIKLMAKNVIDWSDRELASCVVIIDNVEKTRKLDIIARRKKLEELLEHCLTLRDLVKVERYEVRKMLGEAKKFLESFPSDFHSVEVEKYSLLAKTKLQNIWSMLSKSEQTVRDELNGLDGQHVLEPAKNEQLCLDRYSDSTIEDKLAGKDDEPQKKIAEPMKELLKSEADYIEDMRRCVDIYLFAYKTAGSMCPLSIRGKEREIFGNIEELYQFHSNELYSYEQNPEDVGYCFIAWMEKLKELYADYCLNKEENNYLICLPEAISMFSNAYEIVVSIPKLANDRMHLKSFEDYQKYNVGDFVMQDTFLVSEPKRYFKREREFQIFLFESNIVFTKREELSSKKIGYVFKDSMLLRELHVVEHIEGDNTKFGLRKSAFPYQNDQNTTVVKANTEAQRILWVKTLRDLKMDIGRHKTVGGVNTESNRGSRDSQSSLILQSVVASTTLAQLPLEDGSCLSFQSADSGHNSLYSSTGHVIMRETKNEVVEHGFEHFNNNNNVEQQLFN